MTDPMKLPASTCVNNFSSFRPHPFLPGVSIPIPSNFSPADNPTTFNQAALKNTAQVDFSDRRKNYKPAAAPRRPAAPTVPPRGAAPVAQRGRPKKSQESKRDFPAPKVTRKKPK